MKNLRMQEKLNRMVCLDVAVHGREVEAGIFEMDESFDFLCDGKDLCVAQTEEWIWSVGRRKSDGKIFASTDSRFYGDDAYECIWLR